MSRPRSPYAKPNLPPVPGENDETSQLTPNKFAKEQVQFASPSKVLPRTGSNPLLQPLFEDSKVESQGTMVSSTQGFMPRLEGGIYSTLKTQSYKQMPSSSKDTSNGFKGGVEGSAHQEQLVIKASQLTFNDANVNFRPHHDVGHLNLASPRVSTNRSDLHEEIFGFYNGIRPQGAISSDMHQIGGSSQVSNASSLKMMSSASEANNTIAGLRRRSKARGNCSSRSQSRDPSKKHPSFEPPINILDEGIDQSVSTIQKAGDLNSHKAIFFDRKQSSGSLSINNSGGLSNIDIRGRKSITTADSKVTAINNNLPHITKPSPVVPNFQFTKPPVSMTNHPGAITITSGSPRSMRPETDLCSQRSLTQNVQIGTPVQMIKRAFSPHVISHAAVLAPVQFQHAQYAPMHKIEIQSRPQNFSPREEPNHAVRRMPEEKGSLLMPPAKTVDPNKLRDSTIVTEDMMKEKVAQEQSGPTGPVNIKFSSAANEPKREEAVPALQIFHSAVELQANTAFTQLTKPSQPTADSNRDTIVKPTYDAEKNRLSNEFSTRTDTRTTQMPESTRHVRYLSPQSRLAGQEGTTTKHQVAQSERKVLIVADRPIDPQPTFYQPQDRTMSPTPARIQMQYTAPMSMQHVSLSSLPDGRIFQESLQQVIQPHQPVRLVVSNLQAICINPRDSLLRAKLNEVILENSRLRTELGKEREKMVSVQTQLDRLSTIETDFYLLLNHVTHYAKEHQESQKKTAPITPILMELLDLNALVAKEKAKLEECTREKEKLEGINKGLKMKLKDQFSKFSNQSGISADNRSYKSSQIDINAQENQEIKTIAKDGPTFGIGSTAFNMVTSQYYDDKKIAQSSEQNIQTNHLQEQPHQIMGYNPNMMYGSMFSDQDQPQPSAVNLEYSTSIKQEAVGNNPKPVVNIYSSDYVRSNNADVTPKLGGKVPPLSSNLFSGQREEAPRAVGGFLNAFESQSVSSSRKDCQVNFVESQSRGPSSQRHLQKGNLQVQTIMENSENPLAISKSVSDHSNTIRNADDYADGPFHITVENRVNQSSIGGAKKIVSRFATIVPSLQDQEIQKLKEMVDNLAKENKKLQDLVELNSKCTTKRDTEAANQVGINIQHASGSDDYEAVKDRPQSTKKLPKCGSFGDYSSSGGVVQKSAEFCEINFSNPTAFGHMIAPLMEGSKLTPNYKNIDFFGDRPSIMRGTQFGFINITDKNDKDIPKSKRESAMTPNLLDPQSKFDFTSIYSFQPCAEMVSLLNHNDPLQEARNSGGQHCESITYPNIGIEQSIIHQLQVAAQNVAVEPPVHPEQPAIVQKPILSQTIKAVETISRLQKAKRGQRSSGTKPDDEEEEELPIRHDGTQLMTPNSNRITDEETLQGGTISREPKSEIAEVKRMIEDLSNRIQGGDSTNRSCDKSPRDLKFKYPDASGKGEVTNYDLDDDAQSGQQGSRGQSHCEFSPTDDLKAKYLKLMREKAEVNKKLKEEQEKSRKYREMVVAKLRAIETMKDVYQRQIERMVDFDGETEDFS